MPPNEENKTNSQLNSNYHETINIFLQPRSFPPSLKSLISKRQLYCRVSFFDKKTRIHCPELLHIDNSQFAKSLLCTFVFERKQTIFLEFIQAPEDDANISEMLKIAECSFEIGELIGSKNNKIAKRLKDHDMVWEMGLKIPGKRIPSMDLQHPIKKALNAPKCKSKVKILYEAILPNTQWDEDDLETMIDLRYEEAKNKVLDPLNDPSKKGSTRNTLDV